MTARRGLFVALACLVALCATAGLSQAARFTVAGATDTVAVALGQTFTVDVVVREASPSFNAFDLDARFDPARLTNNPMSPLSAQRGALMTTACVTGSPFHLFTSAPDSVVCTMVILCNGVSVTGPGTIYRLRFTAGNTDAYTAITFGAGTAFYMGGPVVDTLVRRAIVVRIGTPPVLDADLEPARVPRLDPLAPNPARSPGSLMVSFRLPRAESARLALYDAQGRNVASASREVVDASIQRVLLALPGLAPGRYQLVLRTSSGAVASRPWVILR